MNKSLGIVKGQIFVNNKTWQCIKLEIVIAPEGTYYRALSSLCTLEMLEEKGWKKVDRDPGYRGMLSPKISYIADHIDRIERRHAGNFGLIISSKWRIASAAELFPTGELKQDGSLTKEQLIQVNSFIDTFKQQFPGVISQYKRRDVIND